MTEQNTHPITVIIHVEDVDRLLRILYHGTRPPMVKLLVCGCGRNANLTESDAGWLGWQVLPYVQCPACLLREPYKGAEARERFIKLVEELGKAG